MLRNFHISFIARVTELVEVALVAAAHVPARLAAWAVSINLSSLIFREFPLSETQEHEENNEGACYEAPIIDVQQYGIDIPVQMIDVLTMADLRRLAACNRTAILHLGVNSTHRYFVQTSGATFRYTVESERPNLATRTANYVPDILANKSFGELFQHEVFKDFFWGR